ncbi:MAG: UDP-glucose/GDP-mannose dehydrogenase family protein [Alphaproteobacteria bacterium]|nr:UDP-glucose/GDP-mannose dehydrogenase family protein [Alphaproteobacteria bacterium]
MHIAMIGTGYVGLVSGACFAELGFTVTCVDKDAGKIARLKQGEIPIYEPGLDVLVAAGGKAGRLSFTTDLKAAVAHADAVFIAVGTPSRRGDGHADLSFVHAAAEEVAAALKGYTVVVTKSTVPVGTGQDVKRIIAAKNPAADFDMVSNPEFLREGSAIEDFMHPDRVVVGAESIRARECMERLYRPLSMKGAPVLFTGIETAELIKYAANAFLATKIMFINEMADICERVGANIEQVADGIGLDKRIGRSFLNPGPGYGGSCFPKDTLALVKIAEEAGAPTRIVETVVAANEDRKHRMVEKIIAAAGGSVEGKTIALLGVTFKPGTDDMRDAPSLVIVPGLLRQGARIRAYDPEGMEEAKKLLPTDGIDWCKGAYEAMEGADLLVLLTEWNEFRGLDMNEIRTRLRTPLVVDLRNVWQPEDMRASGLRYVSVGRH